MRITDDKINEYSLNKQLYDEINNTSYDITSYDNLMHVIFDKNRFKNVDDYYNVILKNNIIDEGYATNLRNDFQLYMENLEEIKNEEHKEIEDGGVIEEEIIYRMFTEDGKIIGETKDFEEYAKYQYDTFGIVVAPPDDYEPSEEYKEIQDSIKDKNNEENSLNLASYSIYKDKIVLKYVSILNNIQVYTLHLDEDGKVVEIDGI